MIHHEKEISLFFCDLDWTTVFDIGVRGKHLKKGLNEVNPDNPTHITLNTVNDIESILAFLEPTSPHAPWLLFLHTKDNNYAFFSVMMIEKVEDWGESQRSTMHYIFKSLVANNLTDLVKCVRDEEKDILQNDYMKSILEKEQLEYFVKSNLRKTSLKI